MIHQFIFAGPKPGLSAEAFQSYWVNFHAVDFAAKITQIKKYLVGTRVDSSFPCPLSFFAGVAEIWLESPEEQLASLQSKAFLEGARVDEPKWAAFWQTLVLDTDPVVLKDSEPETIGFLKVYILQKRHPSLSLSDYRDKMLQSHSASVLQLPKLSRYLIGFARQDLYGLGEPRFDAIEVYSFRSTDDLEAVAKCDELLAVESSWEQVSHPEYIFTMAAQEHWIIRGRNSET